MGRDNKSSTGGGSTISAVSALVAGSRSAPCTRDKARVEYRLIDEQLDPSRTKPEKI